MYQEARLARDTSRAKAQAEATTILLCTNSRHGTLRPTAVYVHRGESLCRECFDGDA